jgi:hypothetical protein
MPKWKVQGNKEGVTTKWDINASIIVIFNCWTETNILKKDGSWEKS